MNKDTKPEPGKMYKWVENKDKGEIKNVQMYRLRSSP